MPQSTQVLIIGLLISLLIGMVIGFYLRQSRVSRLAAALQESQDRQATLQQEHEARLRAATAQLQKDYESQLAEKIERYQNQYEQQLHQLEAEYQARLGLVPEGAMAGFDPANPGATATDAMGNLPVSEFEQRLRKQYETRLKEAAYKIQQAYEQHLRDTLTAAREAQQREFDQRLAEAIAHYQDEAETRLEEALRDRDLQAVAIGNGAVGTGVGTTGVEDSRLQERLATLEIDLRAEYDRRLAERIEQYQDEMTQRTAQLEQEFAARLQMAQATQPEATPPVPNPLAVAAAADIELRLQAEYDQRLAEAIARHQDEIEERTQALEAEFAARLQMAQATEPAGIEGGFSIPDPAPRLLEDVAIESESLEEGSLDLDPFPDLDSSELLADMPPLDESSLEAGDNASELDTPWAVEGLDFSETPFAGDESVAAMAEDPFALDNLDLSDADVAEAAPALDLEDPDLEDGLDPEMGLLAEPEAAFNLDDLDLSASAFDEDMPTASDESFGLDLAPENTGLANEDALALDLSNDEDTDFDADALDALLDNPSQVGSLDDSLLDDLDDLSNLS